MRSTVKYLAVALSVAVIVGIGWGKFSSASKEEAKEAAQPLTANGNPYLNSPFGTGNNPKLPPITSNSASQKTTLTKSEQIDKLTASGNPQDAFDAYKLATYCQRARENKRMALPVAETEIEETCGNITQAQIGGRIKNLEIAVKAGVPGSTGEFLATGPIDGDLAALESRPNDPLVIEWKHRAIDLLINASKNGDVESLAHLSSAYQMGTIADQDPQLALAYETARQEILKQRGQLTSENAKSNAKLTVALSKNLTSDQVTSATNLGKKIAADCGKKQQAS